MPQTLALPLDALSFALLSAAAFAALDLAQKWTARYAVAATEPFLVLRLLGGALLAPLLLLLPGTTAPRFGGDAIQTLIKLVVVNLLGNILYLHSIYRADISVVGSLWPLKNIYLPFLAYVTRHERFPARVYLLAFLATVGALGIAFNRRLRWKALMEAPVLVMVLVTVPVFAVSDLLFGMASTTVGARWTTVLTSWGVAALALPFLLARRENRQAVAEALVGWRGRLGATLTGLFLVLGVYCIGEAFRRAGGSVVLVNVYAMLSGLFLLAVNAALPGRLDATEERGVYAVRFVGAIILVGAATVLLYAGK